MRVGWLCLTLSSAMLATACGGGSDRDSSSSATSVGISLGSTNTLGDGDTTDAEGGDGDPSTTNGESGPLLDIGADEGGNTAGDGGGGEGCEKVDLLFVIDNSGSMADEQASLIASFEGFVNGIQATLDSAESYHIGVVTTDAYDANASNCRTLGALVTQTGGEGASNQDCLPFSTGKRYLDDTEPNLQDKFACIAQVGISGSGDEIQAQSGYTAVTKIMNQQGACNEGFIRDDALLVVVIITDEDDAPDCVPFIGCLGGSAGDPPDWAAQFTQSKNGIQENIVLLALVGQSANNSCGADHCTRLIALSNWFINGSSGDICAPSYDGFFNEAISVIDTACDNFTPPE